jgi:hypothetical protein
MGNRRKKIEAVLEVLKLRSEHFCHGSFVFVSCRQGGQSILLIVIGQERGGD